MTPRYRSAPTAPGPTSRVPPPDVAVAALTATDWNPTAVVVPGLTGVHYPTNL
jgi:hypothetical protein